MTDFGFNILTLPLAPDHWCDADERIFQACFTILGQYVREELGEPEDGDTDHLGFRLHAADIEHGDPSGMEPSRSPDRTAIELWLWYRDELPKLEAAYDAEVRRCYGGTMSFEPTDNPELLKVSVMPRGEMKFPYDHVETVKDQKLGELIALRRALWT